jgi:hypothetical protein
MAILKSGYEEMNAEMKTRRGRMMVIMKDGFEEMKSVVEHQDIPKKRPQCRL